MLLAVYAISNTGVCIAVVAVVFCPIQHILEALVY